ncbi:hypothetical protein ACU7A6_31040 [Pseudomonas aeruginosa]
MNTEHKFPITLPNTLEECEELMECLSASCISCRSQIEAAKAEQKATGRCVDEIWYSRASTALRWMNRDKVRLQNHIARLRKDSRRAHNDLANRLLIEALREHVGIEVFQACAEKARQRMEGMQ